MFSNRKLTACAAVALSALMVSALVDSADARERRGQGAYAGQRGAATAQARTQRQNGTRARDVTITGENGRQRTIHDERSRDRQAGVATHDRTTTFNDGSTRTVEAERLRTGQGQYSASREVTGRNGETRVQTGDFNVTRTENGRTVTGDINTTNAGQIDYTRNVSRDEGTRSVNSSAVFEDGTSIARQSQGSCANGSCASNGSVTGRNGQTTTWEQSRTRTENGAVLERDVTFADGSTRSVDAERTGNGDGTGTVTRSVTGRDGETRTQTGTYDVTRTP
jgi:hypothetical protein